MRLPFVSRTAYNAQGEELAAAHIVNGCLTEDLTAARQRLAEYQGRRTVAEALEEHDVHRKALADALGDQMRHLNWDQLIADVARLNKAANQWMADYEAEKKRADHLQRQLDDAVGLPPGRIEDSSRWQPGWQQPKPKKEATS